MPLTPLEFTIEFIIHARRKLHVPFWKNVPEMNVFLVSKLGCLRSKARGIPSGIPPCGWLDPVWCFLKAICKRNKKIVTRLEQNKKTKKQKFKI